MSTWDYAAIIHVEFGWGTDSGYDHVQDRRWILTERTSTPSWNMKAHKKFYSIHQKVVKSSKAKDPDLLKKYRKQREEELNRIIEKNEIPNAVLIGVRNEDSLDLIRAAASQGWETTGRAPNPDGRPGHVMMRRRT